MDYLVNLNLNKNELQNAVIQPLAAAPSTGKLGQIYYNSADKLMYQYDGTAWVAVGKGKVTDVQTYNGTSIVNASTGIAKLPFCISGYNSQGDYVKHDSGDYTFANNEGAEFGFKLSETQSQGLSNYVIEGVIKSVALSKISGADDLKAIEALSGTTGFLKKTAANTWTLDTTSYLSSQWTAHLITGSAATDQATKAGGTNSVYLNLIENSTVRDSHQIVGSGTVTVASDASGKITITGSAHPTAGTTATAVSTTASGGSATTWSKSDHVHSIALATGDANGQVKIAGSNVSVKGLGAAAYLGVSNDIDDERSTDLLASSAAVANYVEDQLDNLPEPMIFKGSVGTSGTVTWANLPAAAAANEGHTYKVITAHTTETGKPAAEVGDTIISTGSEWVVIPSGDEPKGTVTSVGITNGGLISVSGSPITSSGSITLTHGTPSGATTKTSGFYKFSTDKYGHVNGTTAVAKSDITGLLGNYVTGIKLGASATASTGEVTVPIVSQTTAGLMSAADKTTLDNLSAASTGAITHATLTIAQGQTSVSASGVASKLVTFQAYQGGEAVIVDYDGTNFSVASAAASAITIKCVVTV